MDRDRCRGPGPVPDPEPGTLRRRSAGGLGGGGAGAPPERRRGSAGLRRPGGGQGGPLGRAVGIKLFSDGVLVVGLSAVETDSGPSSPGRTCGLKAGDIITHINGQEVNTIEEVQDILGDEQGDAMTLRATRNGKPVQLSVQAIQNIPGQLSAGRLAEGFHGRNRYHDLL